MYYQTKITSPLGEWTLLGREGELAGLWKLEQKHYGGKLGTNWERRDDLAVFELARAWLARYFKGEKPVARELPLRPVGTAFQKMVWDILLDLPYGSVTTYSDIARQVAKKMNRPSMSSQAVGGAIGRNPLSIIIPCHRVVGSDGSLTGYASGIEVKMKLLALEGVDPSRFFVPKKGTAL